MSGQGTQKLRRNPSPSCVKQGPLKAIKVFGLKASPSASPTAQWTSEQHRKPRRSPDHRASPDRNSPCSPGFKEKSKVRYSPVPPIKRTNSLDAIATLTPYLKGEWPKEPIVPYQPTTPTISVTSHHQIPSTSTCDKFTQTEDDWDERQEKRLRKSHKRSSSLGNDEKLKEKIKARLAKSKEGSKGIGNGQARISPVQGNHYAVTSAPNPPSKAVAIQHIPKSPYRIIGSLEGLNQEIEKLNLSSFSGTDDGDCMNSLAENPTPDGHRAPVLELLHPGTRNVDTQTPSGIIEHLVEDTGERTYSSGSSSQPSSRSTSESPTLQIIPVPGQHDSPRAKRLTDSTNKRVQSKYDKEDGESPNPNKCLFVREPPDGCEKIKIVEENRRASTGSDMQLFCPIKKSLENFHIPSHSSAFCPLMKSYVPQVTGENHNLKVGSPGKDRDLFTSSPVLGIESR